MDNYPENRRVLFLVSMWAEPQYGRSLTWRGSIRTVDSQCLNFTTLMELNQLLSGLSGWQDPPTTSMKEPSGE
jgi:hypothetical protein